MLQTKTYSIGDFKYQSFSNSYILDLIITEESTDIDKNTSLISYKLQLRSGSNNRFSGKLPCYVSINGEKVNSGTIGIDAYYNHTYNLLSGSTNVPHDTDGSKMLQVKGHISKISGNKYAPPDLDINEFFELTSIPRSSSVSGTDADINSIATITIYKSSSSFTHSIKYNFGNLSGYITANGGVSSNEIKLSESNIPFRVPVSFYGQIPNSQSGICTLTCTTYSNGVQIGNKKSATFRVTANKEICTPVISGTVKDVNQTTINLTGNPDIIVRNRSSALAEITATAKNNATITTRSINGIVTTSKVQFSKIESGNFVFYAIDSRKYDNSITVTKQFVSYVPLTLNATIQRDSPTGNTATLNVQGNYFNNSFGKVSNSISISYSIDGVTSGKISVKISGSTYTGSVKISGVAYDQNYSVKITANDELDNVIVNLKLNQGIPIFDWGKNYFDCNVPFYPSSLGLYQIVLLDQENEENFNLELERILNDALQKIDATSNLMIPISFLVSPVVNGFFARGFLCKDSNDYIFVFGIASNGIKIYKNKYGGVWNNSRKSSIIYNPPTVADYVIEEAKNGNWYYRKWKSKKVELWGKFDVGKVNITTAWGGIWSTEAEVGPFNFPFNISPIIENANFGNTGGAGCWIYSGSNNSNTHTKGYYFARGGDPFSFSTSIEIYVMGTY